ATEPPPAVRRPSGAGVRTCPAADRRPVSSEPRRWEVVLLRCRSQTPLVFAAFPVNRSRQAAIIHRTNGVVRFAKRFSHPAASTDSVGFRRSAAGACAGATGFFGGMGSRRRYGSPWAGRRSCSPLLGHNDAARSAWAVMDSDGLTPRLAEIAAPSVTYSVG